MNYEKLLMECANENLTIKEKPLQSSNGRIYNDRIAIKKDLTDAGKTCTLAEELGHYYTTTGDILSQSTVMDRKQEHHARMWAYDKLLPLSLIIKAFEHGCTNMYETAEYLEVTEEFLIDCIAAYHEKYGNFYRYGEYLFIFNERGVGISKEI